MDNERMKLLESLGGVLDRQIADAIIQDKSMQEIENLIQNSFVFLSFRPVA